MTATKKVSDFSPPRSFIVLVCVFQLDPSSCWNLRMWRLALEARQSSTVWPSLSLLLSTSGSPTVFHWSVSDLRMCGHCLIASVNSVRRAISFTCGWIGSFLLGFGGKVWSVLPHSMLKQLWMSVHLQVKCEHIFLMAPHYCWTVQSAHSDFVG